MIEQLEASVGGLQDNFNRIELGVADKFYQMEDILKWLTDTLLINRKGSNNNTLNWSGLMRLLRDDGIERNDKCHQPFFSKLAKLEFSIFAGENPNRMTQPRRVILRLPRHSWWTESAACFFLSRGWSQLVVAITSPNLQRRREDGDLSWVWRRYMGLFRANWLWRFWWGLNKVETDRALKGIPKGIWKAGEQGSQLNPEGFN